MLDSAGLSQKERQLVLTATPTLDFSSIKSALKIIFGGSTVTSTGNTNIKEEPVYLTSHGKRGTQRYLDKIEEEVIQVTKVIDKVVQDPEHKSFEQRWYHVEMCNL